MDLEFTDDCLVHVMEYAPNQTILSFFKAGSGFPEEITAFFFT